MPQTLFLKPRTGSERFNPLAVRLEWFSLHTNCVHAYRYLSVTKCLDDCTRRTLLLGRTLFTWLRFRKTTVRLNSSSPCDIR